MESFCFLRKTNVVVIIIIGIKDEVFYLQSGKLIIKYAEHDDLTIAQEAIMLPGDSFHIYVGLRHQMIALEDSELFEFSTQHFEEDSFRIQKGD